MASWSQLSEYIPRWNLLVAGAVTGITGYLVLRCLRRPQNLPPGPPGFPVIGAIPFLSQDIHLDLLRFREKYKSDVISFYVGNSKPVSYVPSKKMGRIYGTKCHVSLYKTDSGAWANLTIALNSDKVIREAFAARGDLSDRPADFFVKYFKMKDLVFTASYNEDTQKHRKLVKEALRKFGFGTLEGEEMIAHHVSNVEKILDDHGENPWFSGDFNKMLSKATCCITAEILLGRRYELNDPVLVELASTINDFQTLFYEEGHTIAFAGSMLPKLLVRLLFWKLLKKAGTAINTLREIVAQHLVQHCETIDFAKPRDYMDTLLIEYKDDLEATEHITDTTLTLLPDAVETIAAQVHWCLFYLCRYPQLQRRMLNEIKDECGDRPPALQDMAKLPFCNCVMLETLRASCMATISAAHKPSEATTLEGYNIPANSVILANLYSIHYDPDIFSLPDEFNPDRFLLESGSIVDADKVVAFGVGKRACPGETLTKSEMFLFVTHLVYRYNLSFPEGQTPTSVQPSGVFRKIPDHNIIFTKRT